eukprot:CAMPEP_0119039126 /NCGR_PEP_ID=MMETSP1177-20130426/8452_1 /TAXON_ID=2985 /ORGANISM="Ochromonas sp, Strain CCMP1899" /LENGTH=545 /DNA_ID=CAMNT_0007002611 /DNA_START=63 /DNA_END=1700 /DNA_ORIENTATION=+
MHPALKEKIQSCAYLSFDLEMTGIFPSDYRKRNKKNDDPDARYERMVPVASKYGIVQIGLCLFHECLQPDGSIVMEASTYTFYLYSDNGADIALSASSISFLRANKMDFGKWISKGLNYANAKDEAYLRGKYLDSEAKEAPSVDAVKKVDRIVLTKQFDIDYLSRNTTALDLYLADEEAKDFHFEKCNSYLRRVLYQYMEANHPLLTMQKSSDDRLQVLKLSDDAKQQHLAQTIEDNKKSYDSAMGFKLVFNEIISVKKPIIGHNCMYDLMFMMRWLDGPFENGNMENLTDFKVKVNRLFPVIFDTKYIAISGILGEEAKEMDSSLGELYQRVVVPSMAGTGTGASTPLLRHAPEFEAYYSDGGQFHDAGWDAYCTGALFKHELDRVSGKMSEMEEKAGNKLFMMQSLYHMDLDPNRPNGWIKVVGVLLHISNFSVDTKTETILGVFTSADYELNKLDVTWIDGTSTFIAVNTSETAEGIINKVTVPQGWEVKTFEEYQRLEGLPPSEGSEAAMTVGVDVEAVVGKSEDDDTAAPVEKKPKLNPN